MRKPPRGELRSSGGRPSLALLPLVVFLAGAAVGNPGSAAQASRDAPPDRQPSSGDKVVHCHDRGRGIVQEMLAHRCAGEIVSDAEAARIRAAGRRDKARRFRARDGADRQPAGRGRTGYGTAFPIGAPGAYLTAKHTVDGCREISLVTSDGESFAAEIRAMAPDRDIALLTGPGLRHPFPLAAALPADGIAVRAIGYSNQGLPVIRPLTAPAEIVGHGESAGKGGMVAFAGEIRAGASGGPLLDAETRVVGMIVGKIDTPEVYAKTGRIVRGVNFAIDARELGRFLAQHGAAPARTPPAESQDDPSRRVFRVICKS